MKYGWRWFTYHWIRNAIYCPPVEAFVRSIVLCECHLESLVGYGRRRSQLPETPIVPLEWGRSSPLRFPGAPCVLHYDSHAMATITAVEITQNPDAWVIHVNYRGNALRCANP